MCGKVSIVKNEPDLVAIDMSATSIFVIREEDNSGVVQRFSLVKLRLLWSMINLFNRRPHQ